MTRTIGGDKRSSWLTFQRRLFLVRRLIRGPANAATLVADARAAFADEELYPPDASAALRHDFAKLRGEFGCVIRLERDRRYRLESPGRLAVLDLPDAELEALAFLRATFADDPLPNAALIGALLDRVEALLPDERRTRLATTAIHPRFEQPQPVGELDPRLLARIKRAIGRQQLSFAYRSSHAPGGEPVLHRVAPYDLFFREGHTYLEAFCLDYAVPGLPRSYVLYRLDRIEVASLLLLPDQLSPTPPPRKTWLVRYWLSPLIARRRDLALWLPESEVIFHDDGSAEVRAVVGDLWQARQVLLRYRDQCRVLEPAELATMMRDSAERVLALYTEKEPDATTPLE